MEKIRMKDPYRYPNGEKENGRVNWEVEMAQDVNDKKKRNNFSSVANAAYNKETYKISKLYFNLQLRLHVIDQSRK